MKTFNTKSHIDAILSLGLSRAEALIYLAAIESGGGTVSTLAHSANIERTGIYYHIDKLVDLGLLKTGTQGSRKLYFAADPDILTSILKRKETAIQGILPALQEKFSQATSKPIIRYFQGEKELDAFYDHVYTLLSNLKEPNPSIYIFGTSYKTVVSRGTMYTNFTPPQEQINLKIKTILPKSQKSARPDGNAGDPYIVTRYNLPRSEIRFIADKYAYPGSVVITNEHIILYDRRNFFFSITENHDIAQTWRKFFEFTWDHL